ncbi:hypothetical protein GGF50DRAFT_90122 [Schizophyllum commune]
MLSIFELAGTLNCGEGRALLANAKPPDAGCGPMRRPPRREARNVLLLVHRYAIHIADEEEPLEIPVALERKVYAAPYLRRGALVLNDAKVDLDATTLRCRGGAKNPGGGAKNLSGGANNPNGAANNPNGCANIPDGRTKRTVLTTRRSTSVAEFEEALRRRLICAIGGRGPRRESNSPASTIWGMHGADEVGMPGADEVEGARRGRGPGRLAIRGIHNEETLADLDIAEYREAPPTQCSANDVVLVWESSRGYGRTTE